MQKADTPLPQQLWKNQRLIDQNGLVVCQQRERLFDNFECAALFEGLLKIYQLKGLRLHYIFLGMDNGEDRRRANYDETVKYKAYVRFRCANKDFDGGHKVIDYFKVQYELIRLDPSQVKCKYPFLLVFSLPFCARKCNECDDSHFFKIFQSSLYVIRSQFVSMIRNKIFFMQRYPLYNFQPCDFIEKRNSGDVIYEFIKDHNYEPSYYIEKCQEIICNIIKMHTLFKGMDFETVRLDDFKKMMKSDHEVWQQSLERYKNIFKLKYMCRKCEPKQIWTTKDICVGKIAILKLKNLPSGEGKVIYDQSELKQEFQEKIRLQKQMQYSEIIQVKLNIKQNRRLERRFDRSLKKQTEDYEELEPKINSISRWHETIQEYQSPYLVVVSMDIPKMKCEKCLKEKEGLIYITNLLDQSHAYLKHKVIERIEKLINLKDKDK